MLHRAPGATDWKVWDLERAMTPAIFSLGGATLQKLLRGLGIVAIENQARI